MVGVEEEEESKEEEESCWKSETSATSQNHYSLRSRTKEKFTRA